MQIEPNAYETNIIGCSAPYPGSDYRYDSSSMMASTDHGQSMAEQPNIYRASSVAATNYESINSQYGFGYGDPPNFYEYYSGDVSQHFNKVDVPPSLGDQSFMYEEPTVLLNDTTTSHTRPNSYNTHYHHHHHHHHQVTEMNYYQDFNATQEYISAPNEPSGQVSYPFNENIYSQQFLLSK